MAAGQVAAHQGVTVKFDGTPTAMTNEPCSLISGKIYRITSTTKRCIDPRQNLLVKDNGVSVAAANIEAIDYLHGIVTFAAAYTPTTPIVVTGTYIPFTDIGVAESFDFKITPNLLNKTVFGNAFKRYLKGLGDFAGSIGTIDFADRAAGAETLEASYASATRRIISVEIIQDGTTLTNGGLLFRGLVYLQQQATNGDVASLVKNAPKFEGAPMMSTNADVSGSWAVSWSILDGASGLAI